MGELGPHSANSGKVKRSTICAPTGKRPAGLVGLVGRSFTHGLGPVVGPGPGQRGDTVGVGRRRVRHRHLRLRLRPPPSEQSSRPSCWRPHASTGLTPQRITPGQPAGAAPTRSGRRTRCAAWGSADPGHRQSWSASGRGSRRAARCAVRGASTDHRGRFGIDQLPMHVLGRGPDPVADVNVLQCGEQVEQGGRVHSHRGHHDEQDGELNHLWTSPVTAAGGVRRRLRVPEARRAPRSSDLWSSTSRWSPAKANPSTLWRHRSVCQEALGPAPGVARRAC